jgi:predicted transcriptional regulator of viral defense system
MKTDSVIPFENIPYFTIEGFKQAAGIESPHSARVQLHRWAQSGRILSLKKGVYMSRHFFDQHRRDAEFTAAVSAIILPQSYVSLDFVLQQHNLLTDVSYPVTCITLKNTRIIINSIGTFWYRNIRSDLYDGFTIQSYRGIRYATATLAKALFDYLYLRPVPAAYRSRKVNLAEELRLNLEEVNKVVQGEFTGLVEASGSTKMNAILENFRSHPWQH